MASRRSPKKTTTELAIHPLDQPDFKLTAALVKRHRGPYAELVAESEDGGLTEVAPGLQVASDLASESPLSILMERGALKPEAGVTVLVDALRVTVADNASVHNFRGGVEVLRGGERLLEVGAPQVTASLSRSMGDFQPTAYVTRRITRTTPAGLDVREARWGFFEPFEELSTRASAEEATATVKRATLDVVVLSDPNCSVELSAPEGPEAPGERVEIPALIEVLRGIAALRDMPAPKPHARRIAILNTAREHLFRAADQTLDVVHFARTHPGLGIALLEEGYGRMPVTRIGLTVEGTEVVHECTTRAHAFAVANEALRAAGAARAFHPVYLDDEVDYVLVDDADAEKLYELKLLHAYTGPPALPRPPVWMAQISGPQLPSRKDRIAALIAPGRTDPYSSLHCQWAGEPVSTREPLASGVLLVAFHGEEPLGAYTLLSDRMKGSEVPLAGEAARAWVTDAAAALGPTGPLSLALVGEREAHLYQRGEGAAYHMSATELDAARLLRVRRVTAGESGAVASFALSAGDRILLVGPDLFAGVDEGETARLIRQQPGPSYLLAQLALKIVTKDWVENGPAQIALSVFKDYP